MSDNDKDFLKTFLNERMNYYANKKAPTTISDITEIGQTMTDVEAQVLALQYYYVYWGCPYSTAGLHVDGPVKTICNCKKCNGREVIAQQERRFSLLASTGTDNTVLLIRVPAFLSTFPYSPTEVRDEFEKQFLGKIVVFSGKFDGMREITIQATPKSPSMRVNAMEISVSKLKIKDVNPAKSVTSTGDSSSYPSKSFLDDPAAQATIATLKTWIKFIAPDYTVAESVLREYVTNRLHLAFEMVQPMFEVKEVDGIKKYKFKSEYF
jgi:hypothetical protein